MRICLHIDKSLELLTTVAPSELILAEGGRSWNGMEDYDLPRKLLEHLQHTGLDKGNRGELVALVILTAACDHAWRKKTAARAYKLLDFFESLFPKIEYQKISDAQPHKFQPNYQGQTFSATFANAKIYFNHFIKVNDYKVISRKYLWMLMARGAAVLCADNQRGFDIIIPFLVYASHLGRSTISAIVIQVKNDATFTQEPKRYLFDAMNPFSIGFFDQAEENTLPVIRMVFALASPNPAVHVVNDDEKRRSARLEANREPDRFTAYDIWCAQASHATFSVIKSEDEGIYGHLMRLSKEFPRAYEPYSKINEAATLRRMMNPGTASDLAHWSQFCDEGAL